MSVRCCRGAMAADLSKGVSEMPGAEPSFEWQTGIVGYLTLLVAAFLVSWLVTDVLRVRRTVYVGVLALAAIGPGTWYLASSGTTIDEVVGSNVLWGITAGLFVAAIVTPAVSRLPKHAPPVGLKRTELMAWEDVVYGTAEALLLAVYPVLMLWQGGPAAGGAEASIEGGGGGG